MRFESGEWPTLELRALARKVRSGATPRGGAEAYLAERVNYALVRSQNVFDHRFESHGLAYITDAQARDLAGAELEADDVLLNITGDGVTFGRSCLVPLAVLPACVNQHVMLIRVNSEMCVPGYLVSWLALPETKGYIESFNAGGSRRAITKGHIEAFQVPLPPLSVQREVASFADFINRRIHLLHQTNGTLESIAQALFKSWFVDFDPVRAKAEGREPEGMDAATAALFPNEFEESALGLIPKGWAPAKLSAICTNPRAQAKPGQMPADTPYIGLEHMPRKSIALGGAGTAEGLESGKFWFERNDVLFGKLRPYFHKVGLAPCRGVCSTDILVLRPEAPHWLGFLTMHASSDALVSHTTQLSNGARMPRTSWHDVGGFDVVLPSQDVAAAFNAMVSPMFERIHANIATAHSLSETRDALLPRLVSGKLRLPDAQTQLEDALA